MTIDPDKADADGASPSGEQSSAPSPEPTPEQKLAEAVAEGARLRDQLLRTAADFDNYRKRSRRGEDDAQRRGREQMLKELLPVFDNLERAVQHAESAPDAQAVTSGLRMVLKQFTDTLEKSGIKRIPTVGLPFDPTRHEAIQQMESADHPAGAIVAEVQPGYVLAASGGAPDTLIRAALVVVSRGAPAAN
jgi:molecular chaperone GrpE